MTSVEMLKELHTIERRAQNNLPCTPQVRHSCKACFFKHTLYGKEPGTSTTGSASELFREQEKASIRFVIGIRSRLRQSNPMSLFVQAL
jgi:hypothetical protein